MDAQVPVIAGMIVFFGALLAFCFWQLYSVSQAKKQRLKRERSEP